MNMKMKLKWTALLLFMLTLLVSCNENSAVAEGDGTEDSIPVIDPSHNYYDDLPGRGNTKVSAHEASIYNLLFLGEQNQESILIIEQMAATDSIRSNSRIYDAQGDSMKLASVDFGDAMDAYNSLLADTTDWTNYDLGLRGEYKYLSPEIQYKERYFGAQSFKDGWELFQQMYPKSHVIFSVSRIGFNRDSTRAVATIDVTNNYNHGNSYKFFFEILDGEWTMKSPESGISLEGHEEWFKETPNDTLRAKSENYLCKAPLDSTRCWVDARDASVYRTIQVGDHRWMARNLNYAVDSLNSSCYEHVESNCATYGRLYDYASALKACPEGWHLPSNEEWVDIAELQIDLGDFTFFSGFLGGFAYNGEYFVGLHQGAYWWTATKSSEFYALIRESVQGVPGLQTDGFYETDLLSVRCVQDE